MRDEKRIFPWIDKSLANLLAKEDPEDLKRSVKAMFVRQFTKKKVTDLTSIGDAAEIINAGLTPVGKLKVAVCRQMKELAKISCPKTIELVNKWFGAY